MDHHELDRQNAMRKRADLQRYYPPILCRRCGAILSSRPGLSAV
jgi:hypothetical protein